jgi:8-amino-7-oxononanoate synthase
MNLSSILLRHLSSCTQNVPPSILSLPKHLRIIADGHTTRLPTNDLSPIIPLLTRHPHSLSAYLISRGMNARPITYPTVPKGRERVRICLHAGNTVDEVHNLAMAIHHWGEDQYQRTCSPRLERIRPSDFLQSLDSRDEKQPIAFLKGKL